MTDSTDQEVPADDLPDEAVSGAQVPQDDIPDQPDPGSEVPATDLPDEALQQQSSGPLQQAGSIAEGFVKGLAPGLSTAVENGLSNLGVPGISPQDQIARQQANPVESTGSEIAGNVVLSYLLPEVKLVKLGIVGSKALGGLIKMGLISAGDEISKAMLGQGDPLPAVASHIAESGALGMFGEGLFGKVESMAQKGLQNIENAKMGTKMTSFLAGLAHEASFPEGIASPSASGALEQMASVPENIHPASFKLGQALYNSMAGKAATRSVKYLADLASARTGNMADVIKTHIIGTMAEKVLNKAIPVVSQKVVGPALLRAASSGAVDSLSQIADHATSCAQGAKAISKGMAGLFNSSGDKAIEIMNSERDREKLKEFIEGGGVDQEIRDQNKGEPAPQSFADGGEVQNTQEDDLSQKAIQTPDPIARVFPEQNNLIATAKGRVSGYLNSIRPLPNKAKLPFDTAPQDPQHEREYNKALDLANKPLSVLNNVKDGSLTPTHMKHLLAMYPELYSHLSKKMTEKITELNLNEDKKPPYKTRQAMSLFLGSSLESTLTPQGIMLAQSTFMPQAPQGQPQGKSSKADLSGASKNVMTPAQSREQRLNKN